MNRSINFRDKLRDRGFIDQWGFMAFAVVGFAGIFSAKYFEVGSKWVAFGAVFAMFLYAAIVARAGTGRLRADQAGDNCYYLGLIYTLASLSYAIATFDPNDTASTIVQGFGIALATTIFGLVLRVFFSQGRPDLENHEEELRLELTDAVARLKSELNGVVVSVNDFGRTFQQSMEEMHSSATASVEAFTKSSVEGLQTVVEAASGTIREEANDFAARSKRYSTSFNNLVNKLEQHSASIEEMSVAQGLISESALAAASAAQSASTAMSHLINGSEAANSVAVSTKDAVAATQQLLSKLNSAVSDVQTSMQAFQTEASKRVAEISSGPTEAAKGAVTALSSASAALEKHIIQVEKMHADLHTNIAAQNTKSVALVKRHNDDLELELAKSRGMVTKVHSALAEMTGSLAKSVEGHS